MSTACSEDERSSDDASTSPVAVPDLMGDRMSTVYDQLEEVDLVAHASYWGHGDFVVEVSPAPGTLVERGTQVRITSMTGSEIRFYSAHTSMPDLVGLTHSEALRRLGPHFFRTRDLPGDSALPQSSVVLRQTPAAGTPFTPDTKVRLDVVWRPVSGGFAFPGVHVDVDGPNPCAHTRLC
jgi:beta-lactam-binding protein with PASTA domain